MNAIAVGGPAGFLLQVLLAFFMGGYWYWRKLKSAWAFDENTTNRFQLPSKGMLSALYMKMRLSNLTANYALDNCWCFQQADFRVIGNGNVELIDLKGRQLEAMNFWESGEMPKNVLWDDIGGTQEAYAYIPFGRYMGDPDFGLDLGQFGSGVEFEETNTVDTTYFTDGSNYYDIWGLFRKNPEAGLFSDGFFKKRQVYDRNTASETQFSVKMPTENKLKQIHLFDEPDLSSNLPATTPFTQLSNIWLGLNSKEEYMLDNVEATIFARIIHQMFHRKAKTQVMTKVASGADNYADTMIYERENTQLTPLDTTGVMAFENSSTFWERICQLYAEDDAGSRVSKYVYVTSEGILYHGDLPLLMIDPMAEKEAYLDTKENEEVHVEFTEGASTGNIYIVLDELQETYPT